MNNSAHKMNRVWCSTVSKIDMMMDAIQYDDECILIEVLNLSRTSKFYVTE